MPARFSSAPTNTSTGPRTPDAIASSSTEHAVALTGASDTPTHAALAGVLDRYGLHLAPVADGEAIPGTFWGDPEAGLIGLAVHARPDTPVHSVLHESAHVVCMDPARRGALDTNAGGDPLEECAVCYLSILLADHIAGFGRERMLGDMDAWGYSFRLGSARAWFEEDATDAHAWLLRHGLVDGNDAPTWKLRGPAGNAG